MPDSKRPRPADSFDEATIMDKLCEVTDRLDDFTFKFTKLFEELSHVKKTVNEIKDKVSEHDKVLVELKKKVDSNSKEVKCITDKVVKANRSVQDVKDSVGKWEEKVREMEDRMIDQEARSRRNNLIFHGVHEKDGEDCKKLVSELVKDKC